MDDTDWADVKRIRRAIERHEEALVVLLRQRVAVIRKMVDAGMRQREVGSYWGITNPRVAEILRKADTTRSSGGTRTPTRRNPPTR